MRAKADAKFQISVQFNKLGNQLVGCSQLCLTLFTLGLRFSGGHSNTEFKSPQLLQLFRRVLQHIFCCEVPDMF